MEFASRDQGSPGGAKLAVGVGGGDLEAVVLAETPGRAADVEHDGVVHEPVQDRGRDDAVAEDLAPVIWNWHTFGSTKRCC